MHVQEDVVRFVPSPSFPPVSRLVTAQKIRLGHFRKTGELERDSMDGASSRRVQSSSLGWKDGVWEVASNARQRRGHHQREGVGPCCNWLSNINNMNKEGNLTAFNMSELKIEASRTSRRPSIRCVRTGNWPCTQANFHFQNLSTKACGCEWSSPRSLLRSRPWTADSQNFPAKSRCTTNWRWNLGYAPRFASSNCTHSCLSAINGP